MYTSGLPVGFETQESMTLSFAGPRVKLKFLRVKKLTSQKPGGQNFLKPNVSQNLVFFSGVAQY